MEYIIVFLAAMLAGIGTGLVGLSAATAMVPLLIVLCPSFQGEHGPYMATAIALASDILSSAVTAAVYAKNKHIDLKRGWLLTVCILAMSIFGSIAAYYTHQQVLGSFSLFLCVAIGIRFLLKPDSGCTQNSRTCAALRAKDIFVSLFFGLTIGFGTGFFGSGGGMMMLIVLTAMLGYERKTAVGTSTFIMTFTSLIAAVSHILIEPTIVLECRENLILSIVTATTFALISARFANRVNARFVGYVTGAILFALGLILIFFNYADNINFSLFAAFWKLLAQYFGYIAIMAAVLLVLRYTMTIPDYIFRKLLHIVAFTSVLPLVFCTEIWWIAVLVQVTFLIVIVIALHFAERLPFYQSLFVEKAPHEVISSFIMLFGLIAILLSVCWGLLGAEHKYIVVASIMAWGPGDAAAAIVGIRIGRHKLSGKRIEGTKSLEGTFAMGITSFVCTFLILMASSNAGCGISLVLSLIIAALSALVELFTKHGLDTVTVPIAACSILLLYTILAG